MDRALTTHQTPHSESSRLTGGRSRRLLGSLYVQVLIGIAQMGAMKEVGRIGLRALVYFEVVSTLALAIGRGPGAGAAPLAAGRAPF